MISTDGAGGIFYVTSNSTTYEPFFFKKQKILGLVVTGEGETPGSSQLRIPHHVLDGNISAINSGLGLDTIRNSTHSITELQYVHERQEFAVGVIGSSAIPEYVSTSIVTMALSLAIAAIVIMAKRTLWLKNHR
jgi:hypothetical protein